MAQAKFHSMVKATDADRMKHADEVHFLCGVSSRSLCSDLGAIHLVTLAAENFTPHTPNRKTPSWDVGNKSGGSLSFREGIPWRVQVWWGEMKEEQPIGDRYG